MTVQGRPAHMTHFGAYEMVSLLGEGAMGAVYLARDPRFDRRVAIKVLHAQLARDPEVVARFKSEAVIQAKLQHANIVSVLDFVDDSGHLGIVQEAVQGAPLSVWLERHGPQSVAWARRVIDQVARALAHAHAQGLVHRDVKPSNILIAEIDGQPVAKVTDFGIAKVLGSEKLRTATGATMGTLAYMSPEQVRSPKLVDARSDIYSLGAVLFEVLTGTAPFDGDTEYDVMEQIVRGAVPQPSARLAGLPPVLDAVVTRAMAKEPARRYQTCDELRLALSGGAAPVATQVNPGDDGATTSAQEKPVAVDASRAISEVRAVESRRPQAVTLLAGAVVFVLFVGVVIWATAPTDEQSLEGAIPTGTDTEFRADLAVQPPGPRADDAGVPSAASSERRIGGGFAAEAASVPAEQDRQRDSAGQRTAPLPPAPVEVAALADAPSGGREEAASRPLGREVLPPQSSAPPPTPRESVAAEKPRPLRVGGNIKPPQKVRHVNPVYPPIAQSARVQGIVIIEATISPTGDLQSAAVLRSIPLLDEAALEAVRQWQFTPTLINGVPVPVIMTVTVQFTLQ